MKESIDVRNELSLRCLQWDEAIASNDTEAISQYMAEDWVIVGTEGGITQKNRFLDFIRSGDLQHSVMNFENIRVVVYESSAVVTSKGTSSGTYCGNAFRYYEWSTNVFVKAQGQWRCVLTMLTPAQE